jgi:hypothetical protein
VRFGAKSDEQRSRWDGREGKILTRQRAVLYCLIFEEFFTERYPPSLS